MQPDRGAVARRHELDRGLRQARRRAAPRAARRGSRGSSDEALGAAAQDRGVAGLEAQRAGVGGHVRAALVDDADDAERHAHALDGHAVRPRPAFGDLADRIGQRRAPRRGRPPWRRCACRRAPAGRERPRSRPPPWRSAMSSALAARISALRARIAAAIAASAASFCAAEASASPRAAALARRPMSCIRPAVSVVPSTVLSGAVMTRVRGRGVS